MNLAILIDWFGKLDPVAVKLVTKFLVTALRSSNPAEYLTSSIKDMLSGNCVVVEPADDEGGSLTITKLVLSLFQALDKNSNSAVEQYIKYTSSNPSAKVKDTIALLVRG